MRPAVRFRARRYHVGAVLRASAALAEQRAGGPGTGAVAQVVPQAAAGGRSQGRASAVTVRPRPAPGPTAPGGIAAARSLRTRWSRGVRGARRPARGAGARGRSRTGRPRHRAGRCPSAAATAPGTGPVPGNLCRRRSRPLPRGGPGRLGTDRVPLVAVKAAVSAPGLPGDSGPQGIVDQPPDGKAAGHGDCLRSSWSITSWRGLAGTGSIVGASCQADSLRSR